MDTRDFDGWVARYGDAWEHRDASAFGRLFTDDARYYWTPVEAPKTGQAAIRSAFSEAVAGQDRIRFSWQALCVEPARGIARWQCRFHRPGTGREVMIDGVLIAQFADDLRCCEFREWWHSDEHP